MKRSTRLILWGGILLVCVISGLLVAWSDGSFGNWVISVAVLVVIDVKESFPLPDDPVLAEVAVAIRDSQDWAWIVDRD